MLTRLIQFKERHPFTALLAIAIAVRFVVIIFVPGFGSNHSIQQPSLIQHFLEWLKGAIGLTGSFKVMLVSRIFYAFISLFVVAMIYRICDLLSNKTNAWIMALIPTICCIMPSFGIISNVSAFLGLPVILYGSNIVLRQEVLRQANYADNVHRTSFLIAGIMLGLGICIWFESVFIALSIILTLLLKRNGKGAFITLIGMSFMLGIVIVMLLILNVNPWSFINI